MFVHLCYDLLKLFGNLCLVRAIRAKHQQSHISRKVDVWEDNILWNNISARVILHVNWQFAFKITRSYMSHDSNVYVIPTYFTVDYLGHTRPLSIMIVSCPCSWHFNQGHLIFSFPLKILSKEFGIVKKSFDTLHTNGLKLRKWKPLLGLVLQKVLL